MEKALTGTGGRVFRLPVIHIREKNLFSKKGDYLLHSANPSHEERIQAPGHPHCRISLVADYHLRTGRSAELGISRNPTSIWCLRALAQGEEAST
jgi:hypothetical protein